MRRHWRCSGRARELGKLGLEERNDGGVLVVLGKVKGSVPIGCSDARISSGSKEGLDSLLMALCTRPHDRSQAISIDMVDLSTCSEKDTDSCNLALSTRKHESSPAFSIALVDLSTCSEKDLL